MKSTTLHDSTNINSIKKSPFVPTTVDVTLLSADKNNITNSATSGGNKEKVLVYQQTKATRTQQMMMKILSLIMIAMMIKTLIMVLL